MDRPMLRLLFHQVMLLSTLDGGNIHGSGVTDGERAYKCGRSYASFGLAWLPYLDPEKTWLGHTRYPSKGVAGAATHASQPFTYDITQNRTMIAIHNGFITETGSSADSSDPDTDSFRALSALAHILRERNAAELDLDIINTWTAGFGPQSEWAFMIYYGNDVWILRGNRTIYLLPIARGYLFNTSYGVLDAADSWMRAFWPDTKMSKIQTIEEYTAIRIKPGRRGFDSLKLKNTYRLYPDPSGYYAAYEEGAVKNFAL